MLALLGIVVAAGTLAATVDLDPGRVTAQEWRLFSDAFPMLPDEGYPVRLEPRGTAETANLAQVTRWALRSPNELELQGADGKALWTFRWYPAKNLLVSCPGPPGSPAPPIVLAAPGSTIASVEDALRDLGLYRCVLRS